ncbi:hypothetical protein E8E12_000533 [Didymella heteroderae]|uniref:Peptidase A1 domain-containing protein n=1 Tax=Didymella heteroderae TaxID=1769908 RepID=A0A9P5C426_9PLEO|nr:hypothetical protein E8E12_000533 [Didymella heteroderae]
MSGGTGSPSPLVVPNSGSWIGNDGSWSTFLLQVGTPPQPFQVLPSLSGQAIYVPIDQDCAPMRMNITNCGFKRGVEIFDSQPSLGFQKNKSSTWEEVGTFGMGLGSNLGLRGSAYYGFEKVTVSSSLGEDVTHWEETVVSAYSTPDFWIGQLGLSSGLVFMNEKNQARSFLNVLKDKGRIPSLSFGYQAGSPDRFTRVAGSLLLGGYDRSRQSNITLLAPLTPDVIVGVQSISMTSGNGAKINLLSKGIKAIIDTNTPDIWLPSSVCDQFASALGLTYFPEADRYIVNETTRTTIRSSSPTFSFVIGTSTSGGSTVSIEIPYGAFDLQATYPIFSTPTYYFPLRRAANESQFTLGRAFLQEVYLSVDWERNIFNISQAVFSSPPLALDIVTIEPIDKDADLIPHSKSSDGTLSIGAIVGISVGALCLILLAAFGGWKYFRRQERRKVSRLQSENTGVSSTDGKEVSSPGSSFPPRLNAKIRTDLELEGQSASEMRVPYELYGGTDQKQARHFSELAEADSVAPAHELPITVHELPASNNYTRKPI